MMFQKFFERLSALVRVAAGWLAAIAVPASLLGALSGAWPGAAHGQVAAEAEPAAAARPDKILVLGDSLSAAYGIGTAEGWVSLLAQRLKERGLDYAVVNASISGETTQGGLTRLPGLLDAHRPAVVVIALGANDGLRGFGFDTLRGNLAEMVRLARGSGAQPVLAGVRLPPNYGAAYTRGFQAVFREVAEAQDVPLIPSLLARVEEDRSLMQSDTIHPTAQAQPRILDNVWPAIEPQLR